MNPVTSILLITALSIPTTTLVLRTGERIGVDGTVRVDGGQVLFRSGGSLYSIPAAEVDLEASRATETPAPVRVEAGPKLRVSPEERERLLRDLEQNHSGTAASPHNVAVLPGPSGIERQ